VNAAGEQSPIDLRSRGEHVAAAGMKSWNQKIAFIIGGDFDRFSAGGFLARDLDVGLADAPAGRVDELACEHAIVVLLIR
jgi:hypothetical protein